MKVDFFGLAGAKSRSASVRINKKRGPVLLKVGESIRKGSEIQADYESQSMAGGQEMPAANCDENRAHGLLGQVPHKIA